MMAVALGPGDLSGPSTFDIVGEASSIGTRWKRWKKGFQYYLDARGITQEKQAKALLLHSAGMDVQDIFKNLTDPGHPENTDPDPHNVYEKALRTLDAYFLPSTKELYERSIFHHMCQKDDETVDQFVARLRKQGQNCGFDNLDDAIRDQLVDWCSSVPIRRKFLEKGSKLTLQLAQKLARTIEAVDRQVETMAGKTKTEMVRQSSRASTTNGGAEISQEEEGIICFRCGKEGHMIKDGKCTSWGKRCYRCGKESHLSRDETCPARNATCKRCNLQVH